MKILSKADFILQGDQVKALFKAIDKKDFPHAVLFCGDKGTGKRSLAYVCAAAILCENNSERPCNGCQSCRLITDDENPDLIRVRAGFPISSETKAGRQTIPVDDIREVIRLSGEFAFLGHSRVIVIENADQMTIQAQNCLLKTLEDPPQNVYFLLTVTQPSALLPTVLSRCRTISLHAWPDEYIQRLLSETKVEKSRISACTAISKGSIGKAYELCSDEAYWSMNAEVTEHIFECKERSDILTYVNTWKERKDELDRLFDCIGNIISDLYRVRYGIIMSTGHLPCTWTENIARIDIESFAELMDAYRNAVLMRVSSVNITFILETLIMKIMEVKSKCL